MTRKAFTLLTQPGLMLGIVCAGVLGGMAAPTPAVFKTVEVSGQAARSELRLGIEGDYTFKTVPATDDIVFVDLMGVKAAGVPLSQQWRDGLLAGYHFLQYTDPGGQPVVRVQVEMKQREPFRVLKESAGLRMLFGQADAAGPTAPSAPSSLAPVPTETAPKVSMPPAAAPVSNGVTAVSDISIQTSAEGQAVVDVLTSRPAAYRVLHLHNPARVVVDFEEARFSGHKRNYAAQSPVLKDVRVGEFLPGVVRVVADVEGNPRFDVHATPGGVRIELRTRGQASQRATHNAATPVAASDAKFEPKADQQVPQATAPPLAPAEGNRQVVSAAQTKHPPASKPVATQVKTPAVLPAEYQNALPAPAGSRELAAARRQERPTETPESMRAARAAKILAASTQLISAAPQAQTPDTAPTAPAAQEPPPPPPPPPSAAPGTTTPAAQTPAAQTPAATAPPAPSPSAMTTIASSQEKPQYTGEPISLNLKDVDLKDFFRLVHEISGLNIIVDPNVTGSVTLVLDSVPWDQALDIVLKNNHLDKTLEGNVLRIARLETLAAEQENIKKLAEAREEAQPLVTVFRSVNYAKASTISAMLKSWAGGGALTKRGNVLVDERANTLIISDIQSQIPVIESIISKLDKKAKQISIEARIVLATASFSRSLQAALSGGTVNNSGSVVTGGSAGTGASVTPNIVPPPRITIGQTSATGFGAYAVSNIGARYFLNAALAAAETKSLAKTISRPIIITQNNVSGSVQQGSQIPVQTTINNTVSVQYIPATLQLSVTPQVTEDGNIFLNITVNNASPGAIFAGGNPAINTQQATTQVLVPDGGTVVFGGVTVSSRTKSATYVPLVGNIPILGHLFKTSNVQDNDNELLFFVSPTILAG